MIRFYGDHLASPEPFRLSSFTAPDEVHSEDDRQGRPPDRTDPGPMSNNSALLLTVAEAAKLLQISPNTAYELIRQGRIPFVRLGRVIRIPRFGLEQWIAREAGLPEPVLSVVPSRPVH